ncbi:rheb-1 [Pristionchus pacificus]|uniref:Rheb-1 n=1 Tax=Pristionchus pacificus TaxID=54126 RepID=A0A2A6BR52_PRIPA|nr:rheb-1 [Pristionchus pacificus]|eukprot:PDM68404.1 rheb-1 [Pristionchus pacificus]
MTKRNSLTEEATEAVEGIIMNPSPQLSSRNTDNHKGMRYNRKIAIMGYPCVGKSSITLRFINGNFPEAYDTTIEDRHDKTYSWKGRDYALRITDTAGQQEFTIFPRSCSVDVDGFILVYAIDDRKSFEIIQTIHDKIVECVGDRNVPVVVVGNKLDLQYACRAVTREEGEALAKQWNASFVEISARDLEKKQLISNQPVVQEVPAEPVKEEGVFRKILLSCFPSGSVHQDRNQPAAKKSTDKVPNEVNAIFEQAILAIEVAKGNMTPGGKPTTGPGSRESRCSMM